MTNNFCRFLSNGYSFAVTNSKLKVKPCCWYKNDIPIDANYEENIKIRSSINNWTSNCSVCKIQEDSGQKSFRQASFDIIPEINSFAPVAIDFHIDMICNAACVMCSSAVSTLWQREIGLDKQTIKILNNHSKYLEQILNTLDFSHVRRIKFFGGEPLLSDTHLKILEKVQDPSQVDLWYTTNASVLPSPEVIDVWKKFKLVFFEASIDGIRKRFEYIRWPLKWKKVESNLFELRNHGPDNLLFRINHTLNPFNIFYYDELDEWHKTNFCRDRHNDPIEINVHPCWGLWGLEKVPVSLRKEILEKNNNTTIKNLLINTGTADYNSIIDFANKWDPKRKLYWQEIFPEIVKHFP